VREGRNPAGLILKKEGRRVGEDARRLALGDLGQLVRP